MSTRKKVSENIDLPEVIDGRLAIYKYYLTCPYCGSKEGAVARNINKMPSWKCKKCDKSVDAIYVDLN